MYWYVESPFPIRRTVDQVHRDWGRAGPVPVTGFTLQQSLLDTIASDTPPKFRISIMKSPYKQQTQRRVLVQGVPTTFITATGPTIQDALTVAWRIAKTDVPWLQSLMPLMRRFNVKPYEPRP